ncbi:hypothetical protein GCM10023201_16730 [Actinomycetospora corticicola]|uniref:DUF4190 domain-containing protein n=1 Tax=Actinomycetospora corticicola TaxID=663602 RepID=A0A7Y9DV24_9PSEU|nr:hypothetical protein [Actinomycetospora corticicola]NYD35970.1 hypothetical protein [Actinomycetospora corticicola]
MTTSGSADVSSERRGIAGWGTPALVLGVISVGSAWVLGWVGVVAGLAAVIVGFIGARRAFHDPERTGGAALGGLALGLVGLIWGLAVVLPALLGTGTFGEGLTLDECMSQANGQQEQRMCATQHLDEYRARFPGRANM